MASFGLEALTSPIAALQVQSITQSTLHDNVTGAERKLENPCRLNLNTAKEAQSASATPQNPRKPPKRHHGASKRKALDKACAENIRFVVTASSSSIDSWMVDLALGDRFNDGPFWRARCKTDENL